MITLRILYPHDADYAATAAFARQMYAEKLHVTINPAPDAFAQAHCDGVIVGCFGLYPARPHGLLMFETYLDNAYQRLTGATVRDHRLLAELGTRIVQAPPGVRSFDVSLGLTALLVQEAYRRGIRFVGFTANRLVRRVTDALGYDLIILGAPDLSRKDEAFREQWRRFFETPQLCAGFEIPTSEHASNTLAALARKHIVSTM